MKTHLPVNCSSGHRKQGESELISVWPRPLAFHEGQRETRSRFSQGHRVQLDKSFTHFVGGGSGETWGNQERISISHCCSISQVPFYPLQHMYLLFSLFLWNQETRFRTRALVCWCRRFASASFEIRCPTINERTTVFTFSTRRPPETLLLFLHPAFVQVSPWITTSIRSLIYFFMAYILPTYDVFFLNWIWRCNCVAHHHLNK